MRRRVVLTGMGCVTPIGNDVETTWRSALDGTSGAGGITLLDHSGLAVHFACEVKRFVPDDYVNKKAAKRSMRFVHFALASAKMAVSPFASGVFAPDRTGVVYASGAGGVKMAEMQHDIFKKMGPRRISPLGVPMMMINSAPAALAIEYGFSGPNYAVAATCASSLQAIGLAFRHIQFGEADAVLTGGAESAITPVMLAGLDRLLCLSRRNDDPASASRPFDRDRDGIVVGEGAGALMLEDLEHALARKAPILAEIKGIGSTNTAEEQDASGSAIARAMRLALADSGLSPGDIDYVSANGASTRSGDIGEARAIREVFDGAAMPAVSSTKGQTGHLLGAAGAVEAILTVMAVKDGLAPPTANYRTPDPECDLDIVRHSPMKKDIRHALVNNFGFGGYCVSLCLAKFEG